jgi:glyceraldehyde 3-phosphate dehydrogenase
LSLEHLLTAIRYDSTHGACANSIEISIASPDDPRLLPATPTNPRPSGLLYRGHIIHLFSQRDPANIDWKSAGADYIMESTGKMTSREKASVHLKQGAKKVIVSAPSGDVPNVVYGVNHLSGFSPQDDIISNASCTVRSAPPFISLWCEVYPTSC